MGLWPDLAVEPIRNRRIGVLYGLGYLVVGVAIGIRYYFWTIDGAAIAVLLLLVGRPSSGAEFAIPAGRSSWRQASSSSPTLMAVGAA